MHIRESIELAASPSVAMDAARAWMHEEMQPLDVTTDVQLGEIVEGITNDGAQSISTRIDQDGIGIITVVSAVQFQAGSKLTMDLRTEGDSFGAKLRNLSLFPGRKVLLKQVLNSLEQIRERAGG